ncbi:MAG: hypothetical protein E2P02_30800 [Acidobacteria bacterium]|nr:MAG: hypothetical protein E2P02_30800 [Acidobacteriota bacterium]
MEQLFSCRNCIHNCGQSLTIGRGSGYCLKHDSVILEPGQTTCKYLHRKDLPRFVVDEAIREHAAEFANFSALVNLRTKKAIQRLPYSEKFVWEKQIFDPIVHMLAQYYKSQPSWVFVQALSGGVDGRRALTHSALVRRYMDRCATWVSSYRLVLSVVQEISIEPCFDSESLVVENGETEDDAREEARWDVVFARIASVQEYGFHSGVETLMWATDQLDGALSELDWPRLKSELETKRKQWTKDIIDHAATENVFFPPPDDSPPGEEPPA